MIPSLRNSAVCALLLAAGAHSQNIVENISFGQSNRISANGQAIPNWTSFGPADFKPRVMSDRIVLTPPSPGNQRGALSSQNSNNEKSWTLDVEFRVAGPDRGSGNLQIWYTAQKDLASANVPSIYTVDRFEGLSLVLDQYGNTGGAIRGFLNDGTVNFQGHHSVDSLAFGHCSYPYRNQGRFSQLKLRQSETEGFEVQVDGKSCFKSDKIQLPPGYFFGVTAASAENPDSFELSKFVLSSGSAAPPSTGQQPPLQNEQQQQQQQPGSMSPPPGGWDPRSKQPPSMPAGGMPERFSQSLDAKMSELANRINDIFFTLGGVQDELRALEARIDLRHREVVDFVSSPQQMHRDQFDALFRRLEAVDSKVTRLDRLVDGGDIRDHLEALKRSLSDTQRDMLSGIGENINQIVTTSAPKMGLFIFVVLAFQIMLAGSYILYKRRRANSPKKFL